MVLRIKNHHRMVCPTSQLSRAMLRTQAAWTQLQHTSVASTMQQLFARSSAASTQRCCHGTSTAMAWCYSVVCCHTGSPDWASKADPAPVEQSALSTMFVTYQVSYRATPQCTEVAALMLQSGLDTLSPRQQHQAAPQDGTRVSAPPITGPLIGADCPTLPVVTCCDSTPQLHLFSVPWSRAHT
jgi:hypothetical protein